MLYLLSTSTSWMPGKKFQSRYSSLILLTAANPSYLDAIKLTMSKFNLTSVKLVVLFSKLNVTVQVHINSQIPPIWPW
jgi:hypothetical protein